MKKTEKKETRTIVVCELVEQNERIAGLIFREKRHNKTKQNT